MKRDNDKSAVSPREVFKRIGLRATPQRLEIYEILNEIDGHPASEDIYERVRKRFPSISFDTVYRTLSQFEKHGLIKKVHHLADKTRYDTNMMHHHHFVCVRCKKIIDFTWEELDRVPMPEGVSQWGSVKDRYVELRGVCRDCLKKGEG